MQDIILTAFETKNDDVNLVDLGQEYGFEFTEEEGLEVWNEIQDEKELSDFALEIISGGNPVDCGNNYGIQT